MRKIFINIIIAALVCFSLIYNTVLAGEKIYSKSRSIENFCSGWKFNLGDAEDAFKNKFDDSKWRGLNLPHDWSIEGKFDKENPATPGGGALPGGIGWYRKTFIISETQKGKLFFIDFDGVYRNSEVWINEHYLGKRPYGYSSFRYELTPYLKYGSEKNVVSVKVDNSKQPNSRWYSGSGIYRNVWLVSTNKIFVDHWGTHITTSLPDQKSAAVNLRIKIQNGFADEKKIIVTSLIIDPNGKIISSYKSDNSLAKNSCGEYVHELSLKNPILWSINNPYIYKAVTLIESEGIELDHYETPFGVRTFKFDSEKGFILNGERIKINGVCNHHDLGCLGAAVNYRALERQLQIMKEMGVNGIRSSHNPPAPELLDLCDKMGFVVMDEAFDMWKDGKNPFDYSLDWDAWHKRDLEDLILRDRNHPSVFVWSVGNEVKEQHNFKDSTGSVIARELVAIVKNLDTTRPVTVACDNADPMNPIIKSGALDMIGYNYRQFKYAGVSKDYPGKPFISTESVSALQTRGYYDMPSDSIRLWPVAWDKPFNEGNPDNTCSAYDNCCAPWGATNEETWKIVKKYDFISGQFIWTGFDYLGEPTPYTWPSRSSYFGICDLAGFPKDIFYMYKSEWTNKPVLHVFPHWNWPKGKEIDVWTYTNCHEVELFLNGKSLGVKKKSTDNLHLSWRVKYVPGKLLAVGKNNGKEILREEIKTAGAASKIILEADRHKIHADAKDISFVTVKIVDEKGIIVPNASNLINFEISGAGSIAGVDNGLQTSHEPFKANYRKAFNGMCLVVVQSSERTGKIKLKATSKGLKQASLVINVK